MKRRGFLGGVLATLGATAGCIGVEAAETTERHSYDLDGESVVVDNPAGDVTVRTGDRSDVRVRAVKHDSLGDEDALSKLSMSIERSDGVLTVGVTDETESGVVSSTWLDLRVALPEGTPVTDVSVEDDVDLQGAASAVTVESEDGDIRLRGVDGDVDTETGDGDVRLRSVNGDATVETDDGDVTVREVEGSVTIDTDDGDVTVREVGAIGDVTLGDGDATVDVTAVDGSATVSSDDGDITASLVPDIDARLSAHTDDGDVRVEGFDFVSGDDVRSVETTLGDGGSSLELVTDDGDVEIERL